MLIWLPHLLNSVAWQLSSQLRGNGSDTAMMLIRIRSCVFEPESEEESDTEEEPNLGIQSS